MNYERKCWFLMGGFFSVLLFAWWFSFSDTVTLVSEMKDKQSKLLWLKEKEKELPALKEKMSRFESVSRSNDTSAIRDRLTAFISDFSEKNHCLVTEIPLNSSFRDKQIKIQTNTFTIKGNFHQLLMLLNQLERDYASVSKVMSAKFFTLWDARVKKNYLFLTIITQSFEQ